MKKNMIALVLSIVLASSSIGSIPVLATEITVTETATEEGISLQEESITEQEESVEEQKIYEQTEEEDAGLATVDVSEEETAQIETGEIVQVEELSMEEDVPVDEQDESADIATTEDIAVPEEELSEFADLGDTSAEIADNEESLVIEEETEIAEENEAVLAGDVVDSGTCGENATWTLTGTENNLTLTIKGSGATSGFLDSNIPWASKSKEIKTAIVEAGITELGYRAFYSCSSLTSVTIPDSVTSIGSRAFGLCSSLTSITIPSSVTTMGMRVFYACISLNSITIPSSVTYIGESAFSGCGSLTSITIPSSVTYIGESAFSGCGSLTSITIPSSVMNIERGTFRDCSSLMSVTIMPGVTYIGESAFDECRSLTSITIPSSVTNIERGAFRGCTSLTSVTFPNSVTRIGSEAFYNCSSLTSVTFPDSVTQINVRAFACCKSLSEITLPASLACLEDEAFFGCINLKRVVLPDNELDVGENVFVDCADELQFLDRNGKIRTEVTLGEVTPAATSNENEQDYEVWNYPRNSYLVDEGTVRLRVEYTGECLTKEYYSDDGIYISRGSISMELPLFGGFFAGDDSYYLVFGQNNPEEDDGKEVIRIVKYSKEWVRQGAASICGENTTKPFSYGTASLTERDGILYLRTSHQLYTDGGVSHQANLTAAIRTLDMMVTSCLSEVLNPDHGYVSHSFNQIIKSDGEDVIAADHGDAFPRGIVLFRYAGKAGSETLGRPNRVTVFPIAGALGDNKTGVSLGALEASSSHYLIAGNSVAQEEEEYNTYGTRNIFITATPKDDFTRGATVIHWLTSYNSGERISTPVMTVLPNDRFLLMWTVNGVLNYCFIAADGSMDGEVYTGEGSLSDCQPYEKDNVVWWYVTNSSAPVYYYISLDDPGKVHVQNPGHTVVLDAMGGVVETDELEVVHRGTYGELPIPQREAGYEFMGWYTQKYYGTKITSDTNVRVRTTETLYAHWKHNWSFVEETGQLIIYGAGDMGDYCSGWTDIRDLVKRVEIKKGVKTIGAYAFYGCSSLTSITIPSSVTTIEEYAFSGCKSLTSITIPSNVTTIESYAFNNCKSLTSITIEKGVTKIGTGAFYGCKGLTSIIIPDGVTTIGVCAFELCSSLTSITIPSSVTTIEHMAFGWNYAYASIRFRGTKAQWDDAVSDNEVYYKSIIYNCFSVPATFKMSGTSFTYTGKAIKPTVTVTYKGKTLIQGTDYNIVYKNNINTGIATVNVNGIGKYSGTEALEYKILLGKTKRGDVFNLANDIKVTWEAVPGARYYKVYRSGKTDPVFVTTRLYGTHKADGMVPGQNYTYTIVASTTKAGDSSGDSSLSYKKVMYRLKTVAIRTVSNTAPGKMTVKYDKTTCGDSYVLQWSENKDMSGANTKTIVGANNTSYTIGGLKKGKTYYISIRVRKKVGSIYYYTTFGVPSKIEIKK